ncbi:MAG: hypothetical protein HKP28_05895 [Winogradskyella sp.]|nr:hypothetical protein [Winogradskyella sp.]
MKRYLFILLCISVIIYSCTKEINPYLVTNNQIGLLTDSTQVRDLDQAFPNDSISRFIAGDEFAGDINTIDIFDSTGKKLLSLSPEVALDSTSTIETVRIIDDRFHTEKNINSLSTYKDIRQAYSIRKIDNLINSVLISVKELDVTFSIDKKELPSNMRFDLDLKIEPIMIPDKAKIKFFMLHW